MQRAEKQKINKMKLEGIDLLLRAFRKAFSSGLFTVRVLKKLNNKVLCYL